MRKFLIAVLLAALLLPQAAAAERFRQLPDLTAVLCWPPGSTEADAAYVYRYSYPQVEATDENAAEAAETINAAYRYIAEDTAGFVLPVRGESLPAGAAQASTTVSYRVTCSDDSWYSVLLCEESHMPGEDTLIYSAQVFASATDKPGNVITLPYLLGLLADDEMDTWLQDRQRDKADDFIRALVWEELQRRQGNGELELMDGMDYEYFCAIFYPEEHFYLDSDGEPVFFVQPGDVADAELGLLTFRYTLEELLDEL